MTERINLFPDFTVLEEVWVGLGLISELIYRTNGERIVRTPKDTFETFEEFRERTGLSVQGYLQTVGKTRRDNLSRAIELSQHNTPFDVEVTCSHRADGHSVQRHTLRIYVEDQVKFFESRHGLCVLDLRYVEHKKELL